MGYFYTREGSCRVRDVVIGAESPRVLIRAQRRRGLERRHGVGEEHGVLGRWPLFR